MEGHYYRPKMRRELKVNTENAASETRIQRGAPTPRDLDSVCHRPQSWASCLCVNLEASQDGAVLSRLFITGEMQGINKKRYGILWN